VLDDSVVVGMSV